MSHAILGQWLKKERSGYAIAAGGHHGFFVHNDHRPPIGEGGRWLAAELCDARFAPHREELCEGIARVFKHPLPEFPLSRKDEALIVFLTGFMTFADWLGSNEDFFPLDEASFATPLAIDDAARTGRERAGKVMDWLRWGRTEVAANRTFEQLFPFPSNTLQDILTGLAARPGLFIVEAPMGGGKTEAALAAAYRRWTADGGERGLYFALPTQLTSERIFDRLGSFLARALATPDLATLVHGSAWLRDERVIEIHPASPSNGGADDERPSEYARDARLWFASSRQALLAPFGAGTIDQALLGALPAKHCGLRLFGLAGKVVVLDEIHSYDRYTGTLVERLVADLARLNATIIVLSATLTAERKRALLTSVGVGEKHLPAMSPADDYPAITFATRAEGVWSAGVKTGFTRKETPKTVELEHIAPDDAEVWREACEAAANGACVLIIRNTVALAQKTWRILREKVCAGGPRVALLHSRFPRWRRDQLEARWIRRLGRGVLDRWKRRFDKTDLGPLRRSCLLVATQIVEQSVDIDADLLITELAPTDLLFQRLGRLHRHARKRPAGCETPRAILLHPTLSEAMDKRSLKEAMGPSAFVYPPYVLWRSAQQWRDQSVVQIPRDIRPWLETTYASMEHAEISSPAELLAEWTAKNEKLNLIAGRRSKRLTAHDQRDEEGVFTRWNNQPTAGLLLLRAVPERTGNHEWRISLLDGTSVTISYEWSIAAARAIHRNVVRVPRYAVREWQTDDYRWLHGYLDDGALGIVENGEIHPASASTEPFLLRWHPDEGVRIDKNIQQRMTPTAEPEDGWW